MELAILTGHPLFPRYNVRAESYTFKILAPRVRHSNKSILSFNVTGIEVISDPKC